MLNSGESVKYIENIMNNLSEQAKDDIQNLIERSKNNLDDLISRVKKPPWSEWETTTLPYVWLRTTFAKTMSKRGKMP